MVVRVFALLSIAALAGCNKPDAGDYDAFFKHPQDAEVTIFAMKQCLSASSGPRSTQYNDWDEAVEACSSFADDASRYCPEADMKMCLPQYRRTRADVRSALPRQTEGN